MARIKYWSKFLFYYFAAWSLYLIFGNQGYLHYTKSIDEIGISRDRLESLEKRNKELLDEIDKWKSNKFLIEKYAREQLQLVHPQDDVYYLS